MVQPSVQYVDDLKREANVLLPAKIVPYEVVCIFETALQKDPRSFAGQI